MLSLFLSLHRGIRLMAITLFMAAISATAQQNQDSSSIHGALHDRNGNPIGGARLVAASADGHSSETSSADDGSYTFNGLVSGQTYSITVKALGFVTETATATPGGQTVAIQMKVDPLQQSITVFAPPEELKTTADIATTLTPRQLTQLPSMSRNLSQFALLDPRARNTVGSGSDGRQGPSSEPCDYNGSSSVVLY